jgi:tetratricopeptide (TPR) repeat protein
MQKLIIIIFLLSSILWKNPLHAQIENDVEISDSIPGNVDQEKFEIKFFKALSERGIENFEKAIQTLSEIEETVKDEAIIYFQLGLNYADLEEYALALINLEKARTLKADDFNITEAIFEVYYNQEKYTSAIDEAQILVREDKEYQDILAELYFKSYQYEKALEYLDLSDKQFGYSPFKDDMRLEIFRTNNDYKSAISYYQKRYEIEPYNPFNLFYLAQFLASDKQYDKAISTTEELQKEHPLFSRVYVAQTAIFCQNNQPEKALKALETVVSDRLMEEIYKIEAIEHVKAYVDKHPEYQQQFINVLNTATQTAEDNASFLDLAEFYYETDKAKSLENYKKALSQNPQNFKILSAICVLEFKLEKYEDTINTADKALELFPAQVVFMIYKGQSLFNLQKYQEANDVFLEAEAYMFEQNETLLNLYSSISLTYEALQNESKANEYKQKAEKLKSELK